MQKKLQWKILLIVIVVGGLGLVAYFRGIDLGLDLEGGAEIHYRVHIEEAPPGIMGVLKTTVDVMKRRINAAEVAEPRIEPLGKDRILLQLPKKGEKETARIKELIRRTGMLTFHLVASQQEMETYRESGKTPADWVWRKLDKSEEEILIRKKPDFSGDAVMSTQIEHDPKAVGIYQAVRLRLSARSISKFAALTKKHKEERLAIVLDGAEKGTVYSAPTIQDEIRGDPIITGNFSYDEALDLKRILDSGKLPCRITIEYENRVGPSLGQDSIRSGKMAIIIGMAVVILFMALYYLGAGLVANLAVVFNLVILLGILSWLDATLTLPGLAGIVLLVGMSVDANVLIFERIREELSQGKVLSLAIRNSYQRVFVTIFDANLTTLFTAVILYVAGTGPVRGFAVTLGVGLLASMFTALFVTRAVFDLLIHWKIMSSFKMFALIKETAFRFSTYWKSTAVVSAVCILLGLSLYFQQGTSMYDIDFMGGALIHIRFSEAQDIEEVREDIESLGKQFKGCQVQSVWSPHEKMVDSGKSKEFELRMEIPSDKEEQQLLLDNTKAALRGKFAKVLAEEVSFQYAGEEKGPAGIKIRIALNEPTDVLKLQDRICRVIPDAKVTGAGQDAGNQMCARVMISSSTQDIDGAKNLLDKELSTGPFPRVRNISAVMAREMVCWAGFAMVLAMVGIVIYMAFRFQLGFGVGACVALVHDVLITMGALAVAQVPVNLPIIAAFLTIVGYSLNDTIVVFDRIRENMRTMKTSPLIDIVNLSINQTLGRTLLTSLTTLFAAGALFVWGGGVIHNFAYALIIGVAVGTYSSIFVASPVAVLWEGGRKEA